MAKSKLTKFRLSPATILRFNPAGNPIPFVPDKTDIDREIVESVMPGCAQSFSRSTLAILAAAFVEKGMARA